MYLCSTLDLRCPRFSICCCICNLSSSHGFLSLGGWSWVCFTHTIICSWQTKFRLVLPSPKFEIFSEKLDLNQNLRNQIDILGQPKVYKFCFKNSCVILGRLQTICCKYILRLEVYIEGFLYWRLQTNLLLNYCLDKRLPDGATLTFSISLPALNINENKKCWKMTMYTKNSLRIIFF